MKLLSTLVMIWIGFSFGICLGLWTYLPVSSLPARSLQDAFGSFRSQRSLQTLEFVLPESEQWASSNRIKSVIEDKATLLSLGAADQRSLQANYNSRLQDMTSESTETQLRLKRKSSHLINEITGKQSGSIVYVDSVGKKLVYNETGNDTFGELSPRDQKSTDETVFFTTRDGNYHDAIKIDKHHNKTIDIFTEDNILYDNIFWSTSIEDACPNGFSIEDQEMWKETARNPKIVKIEEGCGRMQNRLLTFHDSRKACARYRLNVEQIQGDIYSYYLGKLLGMKNIPPSTLQVVNFRNNQWNMVENQIATSQWTEDKPFVLTRWIDGLSPAYIPHEFREQNNKGLQPDHNYLKQKTKSELCELLQWSDLIIFDYLTANLDRVVNNMFNKQWNDQMMNRPAHNLEKSSDGHLVFLDNESGLFHGYRLLDKYAPFHQVLLDSLCLFRKSTVDTIERLVKSESIGDELQKLFEANEPLFRYIPKLQKKNIKVLNQRLFDINRQVQRCYSLYYKK